MLRITRLEPVESIKAGLGSTVAPDGTIINPEPYHGCNVAFDDGVICQVERPLTLEAIRVAYELKLGNPATVVDGIHEGDEVPPATPP